MDYLELYSDYLDLQRITQDYLDYKDYSELQGNNCGLQDNYLRLQVVYRILQVDYPRLPRFILNYPVFRGLLRIISVLPKITSRLCRITDVILNQLKCLDYFGLQVDYLELQILKNSNKKLP